MKHLWLMPLAALVLVAGCYDGDRHHGVVSPNDTTPPAAPRGLFSVTGDGEVFLHWQANTESDVAGYRVYKSPCSSGSSCPYDLVGATTGTSFTVSGLNNGQTRYYAVAAYDRAGNESDLSYNDVYDTPEAVPAAMVHRVRAAFGPLPPGQATFAENFPATSEQVTRQAVRVDGRPPVRWDRR